MTTSDTELLGLHEDLDHIIEELAFLSNRYRDYYPASTGDVSQILSQQVGERMKQEFESSTSPWFDVIEIHKLSTIRRDGRSDYRGSGVDDPSFLEVIRALSGRVFLITRTGAQIPEIPHTILCRRSGELFNLVEVDEAGARIRLLYGNAQFGSIPSIEIHVHMAANALSIREGHNTPATVHAHPPALVRLGRHPHVAGDFKILNTLLLTQIEGLNRIYDGLVGVVPYFVSGSSRLASESLRAMKRHHLVLWMNHGVVTRSRSLRRAFILTSYTEESAKAAYDTLQHGAVGLPEDYVEKCLAKHGLQETYAGLQALITAQRDCVASDSWSTRPRDINLRSPL